MRLVLQRLKDGVSGRERKAVFTHARAHTHTHTHTHWVRGMVFERRQQQQEIRQLKKEKKQENRKLFKQKNILHKR